MSIVPHYKVTLSYCIFKNFINPARDYTVQLLYNLTAGTHTQIYELLAYIFILIKYIRV
jgi:hypothetical protein